jgi:hypothetical protein
MILTILFVSLYFKVPQRYEINSNKRQFTWHRKDKSQTSRIAFIYLNVIVISLISTLSASHNSLQFFKSLLILADSNKRQFTWRRKDKSQASRIDYILVNKHFKSNFVI